MLALTAAPGKPGNVELREVADPVPHDHETLVRVRALSLNRGEVRNVATFQEGDPVGWDLAGVVERSPADGSGPAVGTRVVGLVRTGAWAERVALSANMLAPIPDDVTFEQAATLPVAGLTALRALDIIGPLLARRALVTGASGGVGRFAVQLARLAGAHVTAVSSNAERAKGLRELGADEIIHELEPTGSEFDAIVEGVGGASLAAAIQRIATQGTIVSFASSDTTPVEFPARSLFARASGARLVGIFIFAEALARGGCRPDLLRLLQLVAGGRLDCSIDEVLPWSEASTAIAHLVERTVNGKVVLTVG